MSLPSFGVRKPVPVNLLMLAFIIGGAFAGLTLTREFFPDIEPSSASITLPYPGASPEEIEDTLAIKVEDEVSDLEVVDKITTSISEGGGTILVEFRDGIDDFTVAVDEVELAVESLLDLPEEAERLQVIRNKPSIPAIMMSIYGPVPEAVLKTAVRDIRDDLKTLPGMGEIEITGTRNYEIRVDIDRDALLAHGMSLPQVAQRIRMWMQDVPGGTVRTDAGDYTMRTMGVEEGAETIRDIIIRATPDGQILRVRDIGEVREGFVDDLVSTRFAAGGIVGPSASLIISKVGDQDAVEIAEMARAYVDGRLGRPFTSSFAERIGLSNKREAYEMGKRAPPLPEGTSLALHSDLARFIEGRLALLSRNAFWGMILVFATLLLFLNWRVAFWVGVGLMTALCGTLLVMNVFGITLNLLTMFGLIIVLGLLVDDAIVVAENIQAWHDRNETSLVGAIKGAEEVFWPVVATVMTSIVAFLPMLLIKGETGDLFGALPYVVACALAMSLVESVMILPSHMGHSLRARDNATPNRISRALLAFERRRDGFIQNVIIRNYGRLLSLCLHFRYVAFSIASAALIVSLGMVAGEHVEFEFLPSSDSETIIIDLRMPTGTPLSETQVVVERIEQATEGVVEINSVWSLVGMTSSADLLSAASGSTGSHMAQFFIELLPVEVRDARSLRSSQAVIDTIRENIGPLDGVDRLRFSEIQGGPGGTDITIQVAGPNIEMIDAAAEDVKTALAKFEGVYDIADDNAEGQREVRIELLPGAAAMGFAVSDVAEQVRAALFGIDAHVFSDRQEDIDVRVRLDESSRRSLQTVENLWIIAPDGRRVPLQEIAKLRETTGYSSISRIDRRRTITVLADCAETLSPNKVLGSETFKSALADIRARYPQVTIGFGGQQEQQAEAFGSLPVGFLAAMILIYVILAWLFGSYTQPIAVMLGVPFALVGVIWGHWFMGYKLTLLSVIGFVALSGIVVNDSLILVEFFNAKRREGASVYDGLMSAGQARLRAIFLTTITTVLGLTPFMLETSFQAKFLIPMAISIAFGLMSATVLILLVLPCIIVMFDDVRGISYYLWHGLPRPSHDEVSRSSFELETE